MPTVGLARAGRDRAGAAHLGERRLGADPVGVVPSGDEHLGGDVQADVDGLDQARGGGLGLGLQVLLAAGLTQGGQGRGGVEVLVLPQVLHRLDVERLGQELRVPVTDTC